MLWDDSPLIVIFKRNWIDKDGNEKQSQVKRLTEADFVSQNESCVTNDVSSFHMTHDVALTSHDLSPCAYKINLNFDYRRTDDFEC